MNDDTTHEQPDTTEKDRNMEPTPARTPTASKPGIEELDRFRLAQNSTNRPILSNGRKLSLGVTLGMACLLLGGCTPEKAEEAKTVPVVKVATVGLSDSAQDLVLSGQLEAETSVAVSFATMGSVEKVLVSEGQAVKQGQVLAVLDAGMLKDQLALAQAKANQAEDAWKRMEPMHRNGTLPEIKWVEVETGREQARSSVSMSTRNLQDAVLKAPLSGIVAKRSVQPGERAMPGTSAFTLVQTGTVLAVVAVPEKEISRLRVGKPAKVRIDAVDRTVSGTVREIGVEADPFTRTYKVKVALPNPDGQLRVGMVAQVRLTLPGRAPSVLAPLAAVLVDENQRRYAWVMTDSVIHRRVLRTGSIVQEGLAVDSGLKAGETVVVSGTPMLSEGLRVQVGK